MKVGVFTFHASHNYGAMLQTYALKKSIEKLGHSTHVIDFFPRHVEQMNKKFKRVINARQLVKNGLYLLQAREWIQRYKRYENFKNDYFNLTQRFFCARELEENLPKFDAYIAGSDQVWNAERGIDPVWLLDFVARGRKIAYAPSFGADHVVESAVPLFQKYLPTFAALSCRELQGVEMIRQMTGLEATHVLDPTLLLTKGKWDEVGVAPAFKHPYILVYCLEESPSFMELVPIVSKRTGLDVVVIGYGFINRFKGAKRVIRDAGPAEFVGLFSNADMVCTNSFHGTAFSIIFEKPFFSVPHTTRNSRIAGLLKVTGLECRQCQHPQEVLALSEDELGLDYSSVSPKLLESVQGSISFLKHALS